MTSIPGPLPSLYKSGLSKEAFVATEIVIACMVDSSRPGVYMNRFLATDLEENFVLLLAATTSAFVGAYAGSLLLKSVMLKPCTSLLRR